MSDISNRILEIIQEKDISYGELSDLTNIPKSALQRYATGQTEKIPINRLECIARALGTTAAYLMGWESTSLPYPQDDLEPGDSGTDKKVYWLCRDSRNFNPEKAIASHMSVWDASVLKSWSPGVNRILLLDSSGNSEERELTDAQMAALKSFLKLFPVESK